MNVDMLIEMIRNTDEKVEKGHGRLRQDYRELAERVNEIENRQVNIDGRVTRIEKTPPPKVDVSNLQFEPRMVFGIVLFAISVFSANYASNYSIRSDVRDILTKMDQQEKVEQANAKVVDERANTLRDAIDSIKKRQELQSYEIQEINKTILALKSATK